VILLGKASFVFIKYFSNITTIESEIVTQLGWAYVAEFLKTMSILLVLFVNVSPSNTVPSYLASTAGVFAYPKDHVRGVRGNTQQWWREVNRSTFAGRMVLFWWKKSHYPSAY
jgi:hypothetical protein